MMDLQYGRPHRKGQNYCLAKILIFRVVRQAFLPYYGERVKTAFRYLRLLMKKSKPIRFYIMRHFSTFTQTAKFAWVMWPSKSQMIAVLKTSLFYGRITFLTAISATFLADTILSKATSFSFGKRLSIARSYCFQSKA
jgi:hypothetical protein